MLKSLTRAQTIVAVFGIAAATILGAWAFQVAGFLPCELCLKQRVAYYVVLIIAALALGFTRRSPILLRQALLVLGLVMVASCLFGIYHAGVEWKFWAGPETCTGAGFGGGLPDLTKQAVMCDQPAIRIVGLSLAGWNAIISAFTAWLCLAKAYGSSSASQ